jgi:hypothetical protein
MTASERSRETVSERRARLIDLLLSWVPFGFYVPLTAGLILHYLRPGDAPGYDGWLYRQAAATWLAGGDPWSVGLPNAHFPGAPSSIIAFVPTVALPPDLWRGLVVVLCLAAGAFLVRRLGYSWLWLAYPPLSTGILLGQPGVIVGALLVTRLAVLAPLFKPWAGIPLLFQPRRAIVAAAIGLATVVLASGLWLEWFRRLPELSARLSTELHGGMPVWASAVGAAALFVVWRRRPDDAPWLAVSAVWPYPEYHNAILAMPTRNRPVLLILAVLPGPLAVVLYAVFLLLEPVVTPLLRVPRPVPATRAP